MESTPLPPNFRPPVPPAPSINFGGPGIPKPTTSTNFRPQLSGGPRPGLSFLWGFLFFLAIIAFLVAYFVFTKPNTGPASLIFNKIFPPDSGIIKLQEIDLDIDSIVNHPIFSGLREKGPLPISIPPLGKPNPFL